VQSCDPLLGLVLGLFHERSHRQAINEAARPLRIMNLDAIPKPCEHDGGCFAEAGWNVDELRTTISPIIKPLSLDAPLAFATCKSALVVERSLMVTSGQFEKLIKIHTLNNNTKSIDIQ
jgi:hypothetical protein